MKDYKQRFDIFICGGSQHVNLLKSRLPTLRPFGRVHLASSFLASNDLDQLGGLYDVLHKPQHSRDGYRNFELFSIRDINQIASAPYFIKLDADTELEPDWIKYVEETIVAYPDTVLFGPRRGNVNIEFEISGSVVQELLRQEIRVTNGSKVIGGFYVGRTSFFREHQRFMALVHEFLWCYRNGVRYRPLLNAEYWPAGAGKDREYITVKGGSPNFPGNEDSIRSLVVHAVGAGERLRIVDSHGKVRINRQNIMNESVSGATNRTAA
jgi:hypothetical protein